MMMQFSSEFRLFLKRIKNVKYKDFEIQLEKVFGDSIREIKKGAFLITRPVSLPAGSDFELIEMYHDIGKINDRFQKYIQKSAE